jgi:hypothetical protein
MASKGFQRAVVSTVTKIGGGAGTLENNCHPYWLYRMLCNVHKAGDPVPRLVIPLWKAMSFIIIISTIHVAGNFPKPLSPALRVWQAS